MACEINLIEDEEFLRDVLVGYLQQVIDTEGLPIDRIQTFGSAEDYLQYRQAPECHAAHRFVILDMYMEKGRLTGFAALREEGLRGPHDCVWAISRMDDLPTIRSMLEQDLVDGYVCKGNGSPGLLAEAIRAALRGEKFETDIMREARRCTVRNEIDRLSPRELEVVRAIVLDGRAPKQIAADLDVSLKTIYKSRERALEKLGMTSERELYEALIRAGYLPGGTAA